MKAINAPVQHLLKPLAILTFLALTLVACISNQANSSSDASNILVEISKGPCYGSCPVYKMTIYRSGQALYEGQSFTERQGEHVKKISPGQLSKLRDLCDAANIWDMPDAFRSQYPDLPTVTITYFESDRSKSVMGKEGRPKAIMDIEKELDDIAESGAWVPKTADTKENKQSSGAIQNEIIVQLMEGVDGNIWVNQYAKHNMQLIKRLSPRSFYWLVKFDTKGISSEAMIEQVRQDAYVVSAEFNRTVDSRN